MAWINHKQQRPYDGQAVLIYYADDMLGKPARPALRTATYFEAVDLFDLDTYSADEEVRPSSTAYLFWQPKPDPPTPEQIAEAT